MSHESDSRLLAGHRAPPRLPKPGELLFEFVRASDGAPIRCELMFHGESYGWEARFLERGELFAVGVGIKVSRLACAGRRDRPLEGNSGQEGVQIHQPLDGETPSGAGEPTCAPRDGRGFHT